MTLGTQNTTEVGKAIVWSCEDHDYACYVDGNLIGFARSYHEAEGKINAFVYEQLRRGSIWSGRGTAS